MYNHHVRVAQLVAYEAHNLGVAGSSPAPDPISQLDVDLDSMSREELLDEIKKLRDGIRQHRDSTGHNLCWYVPELWALLPEKVTPEPHVPPKEEFLRCCATYRDSLDKG